MTRALPLLWLAYPLLVHLAVAASSAQLLRASGLLLAVLIVLPTLLAPLRRASYLAILAAAGIVCLTLSRAVTAPLLLMPVAVTGSLAWFFGRTLAPGRTPLIESIVVALHDPDADLGTAIPRYARRLTLAWTVLLTALAVVNFLLACLVSPGGLAELLGLAPPATVPGEVWSSFANVLNYVIVAAFFVAEYAYRRRRFPEQPYRNLGDFAHRLLAIAPQLLKRAPQREGVRRVSAAAPAVADAVRADRR
jgi:uncharacterized membrane protein